MLPYLEACWVLESKAAPIELGAALRRALAGARTRMEIAIAGQKMLLVAGGKEADSQAEHHSMYILAKGGRD